MAKWFIKHLEGKSELLPDGSHVVNGIVETIDDREPKASHTIREYYGAVPFEESKPATPKAVASTATPKA